LNIPVTDRDLESVQMVTDPVLATLRTVIEDNKEAEEVHQTLIPTFPAMTQTDPHEETNANETVVRESLEMIVQEKIVLVIVDVMIMIDDMTETGMDVLIVVAEVRDEMLIGKGSESESHLSPGGIGIVMSIVDE
jgi:siderophore synthetase component